jgi:hypothetical protein
MRHRDETHVVIIMRMSGDTVRECSIAGVCSLGCTKHSAIAFALFYDGSTNDVCCSLRSAGENDANRVA